MPAFTFRAVKDFYPTLWEKSRVLVQGLANLQASDTSDEASEPELEVNEWASKAALDIIGVSTLNKDYNSLRDPDAELGAIYRRIFSPKRTGLLMDVLSLFLPLWLLDMIP